MRLIRWMNCISLRKKILFLAVGIEILILGIASMLGLYILSSNHVQLSRTMANSLVYASQQLDQSLGKAKAVTGYILADSSIQKQLSLLHSGETEGREQAYRTLYDSIITYFRQYRKPRLRYISIITDSFSVSTSLNFSDVSTEVINALCTQAKASDGAPCINTEWSDSYGIFVCRSIRQVSPFNLETTGVVILCLDTAHLVSDATDFAVYDTTYYILRDKDTVFYVSPQLSDTDTPKVLAELKESYDVLHLSSGRYFAQQGTISSNGWNYICLVPYDKQWRAQRNSYLLFLAVLLATMLLMVILSHYFSRSISKGITALVMRMQKFRGQNMQTEPQALAEISRNDEVGLLNQQFNQMTREISDLIQDKYISELLTKNAQLKALEAQVNPHFLYNVLESINWRAHRAGVRDISEIVDALGSFLRVSLDQNKKHIALSEELQLVDCYMLIQQYRYEEHIQYTKNAPSQLLDIQIPKLVIQPLVDNAVKYSVESSLDDYCTIDVSAESSNDVLTIMVRNSGSEVEEDLLEQLQTGKLKPHGFGIGLANIDERLRLTFGVDFGLTIFNENGHVVCIIKIPIFRKEPSDASINDC